jgi:hypothetical protein
MALLVGVSSPGIVAEVQCRLSPIFPEYEEGLTPSISDVLCLVFTISPGKPEELQAAVKSA